MPSDRQVWGIGRVHESLTNATASLMNGEYLMRQMDTYCTFHCLLIIHRLINPATFDLNVTWMFINGFPIIMRHWGCESPFFARQARPTRTAYSRICRTKGKRRHLLAGIPTIEDTNPPHALNKALNNHLDLSWNRCMRLCRTNRHGSRENKP